jgi:hypothetical protein
LLGWLRWSGLSDHQTRKERKESDRERNGDAPTKPWNWHEERALGGNLSMGNPTLSP